MIEARKCKRPSKCRACGKDMRVGEMIVPFPRDAKLGHVQRWTHEECAQ